MGRANRVIRLGSRGSQLALWQAEHIRAGIERETGRPVEITRIKTTGDMILDVPLSRVGGKGLFVKEIEEALLSGRIDLAVHSMKDVPTDLPDRLEIVAITRREDPRDAFLSVKYRRLEELPQGGRVGTSSLRRQTQLLGLRPDLRIESLRGNLDTRIRKRGSSTPSSWRRRESGGSAGRRRSPSTSPRSSSFPPSGRGRWGSRSGPTIRRRARRSCS